MNAQAGQVPAGGGTRHMVADSGGAFDGWGMSGWHMLGQSETPGLGSRPCTPGRAPALGVLSQATPASPSRWPFWIPEAQLPQHYPRPQHTSSLMSAGRPTHPQSCCPGWGWARDTFPWGQRDFSLPMIDFVLPPPPPMVGRGDTKKPPEERNPKLQTRLRAQPGQPGGRGQDQGGQGERGTDADKWVLPLRSTRHGQGCGHRLGPPTSVSSA